MTQQTKKGPWVQRVLVPWAGVIAGALIAAFGYASLIIPNNMLEGGVTGVGIIANRLFGLPPGTTGLALTALVFVVGVRVLGRGFGAKTIVAATVLAGAMDAFIYLKVPALTHDKMLALFWGGAVCGLGLGLVYYFGAATGGADALAQILRKLFGYTVARTLLVIDVMVLGGAVFLYGAEQVMYSLLMIFIEIKVIDLVLNGARSNQLVTIVSTKPEAVRDRILRDLNRGLTMYPAEGGYTRTPRMVLQTVMNKKLVPALRRVVAETDRKAFVIVADVHQCYGEGFDRLPPPGLRLADATPPPLP